MNDEGHFADRPQGTKKETVLSRFGKGVLIGAILYLLLLAFL